MGSFACLSGIKVRKSLLILSCGGNEIETIKLSLSQQQHTNYIWGRIYYIKYFTLCFWMWYLL